MTDLRQKLQIPAGRLEAVNALLLNPDSRVINEALGVIAKYGTVKEINARAVAARRLPNLLARVREQNPEAITDLQWLEEQRDRGAFTSVAAYRERLAGQSAPAFDFKRENAVTLERGERELGPQVQGLCVKAGCEERGPDDLAYLVFEIMPSRDA